ncbi:MAG: alpha-mannosidase [Lachnospiraceae bacterium]|nr:alpha-mannosidase [Lachnospiraceae bacterium]
MFFTKRKLENRKEELKLYRYRDAAGLTGFVIKEDLQGVVNPKVPVSYEGWDNMQVGDTWRGRDRFWWLHVDVEIPAAWAGKRAVAVFDFGMTGGGNNSGFESLLYINGEPYQGVDANHREVFFKEDLYGKKVSLTFRLWSGLEGGGVPREMVHEFKTAQLGWLDEAADDLIYMSEMILKAIDQLAESEPVRHQLQANLDKAMSLIDWSYPGSEAFYASVKAADDCINGLIDEMGKKSDVNVYAVGHTHIDTAWLWRLKNTREKCSRSFSTVMRLMEMFPEYYFLQTQPQLYEYIKEDFPEIYKQIKARVAEGRWEADGAMWVEADCNLTSGESLTRQILIGSKFIQDEFGKDVHYLWLPDVFGYSWALPQVLKKSGIDMFMTTKISWNQYNRMPHDTFKWKGIDGSEVLTHFITTPEPWNPADSWFYTYNGLLEPRTVKGVWDAYSEKEMNQDLLISYGYGDGGGGVNRDMLEHRRRLDRIPGLPNIKTSTAGAYFEKLKENVKNTDSYVNTWDGELYLEYHRGTYTSHAHNKRMNRKMELLYREAEWLTVMDALLAGGNLALAQQEKLTTGWKHILTNQFHDIIPGSSIFEVYEDCKKDYEWIESIGRQVEEDFFAHARQNVATLENAGQVSRGDAVYTVINPNGFAADGVVLLEDVCADSVVLADGTKPAAQKTDRGLLVALKQVPSMGFVKLTVLEKAAAKKDTDCVGLADAAECGCADERDSAFAYSKNGRRLETPFYQIVLNESGQIARLYDKEFEREVLPEGACANVLQMFEDKPMGNDAWDIDIFYQQKMREITNLTSFEIAECGPVRMVIRMRYAYMNSTIWQDLILYAHSRRIDFVTKVDYHEQHQLLKAAFPVDIRTTYGTFDVQYGNVRRPNHWNTSWDQAKFETVAHRFADLSEYGYGVSLLNDCKYGHDVKDNVLRITLIKAATYPDHSQDIGEHVFTYALLPHGGDFVEGRVVQEASMMNQPLHVVQGNLQISAGQKNTGSLQNLGNLPLGTDSFLFFDKDCVELDAIKKTEDGKYIAVRFHDFTGGTNKVRVNTGFAWKKYCVSDLRERPLTQWKESKAVGAQEGQGCDFVRLTVKPYEIVTLLFEV